ncbi:MAG TPA: PilZ domain-containing protein [Vicinamibacterales bacterium]|nr:PilZ domain-containing protein [Vicinamibacterales bacterium]
MTSPCAVLIGAPNHLEALEARLAALEGEKLAFTDTDALRALQAIVARKPAVIALERLFAASPRGAALIHRIKADPTLRASEIRVVAHDSDYMRISPRPAAAAAAALDQRGTRRAPRFKIKPDADSTVDGQQALIIDLSTVGAQVVCAAVMKPNQRVKVSLADDIGQVRFEADVAWASFELQPKGGPRYRAGLAFIDATTSDVDAYCSRHKAG